MTILLYFKNIKMIYFNKLNSNKIGKLKIFDINKMFK